MLLGMKSTVESLRALAVYTAAQLDRAHAATDAKARAAALARGELLIPIVKAWSTEQGIEVASTGVQVHGGMGYIEETGAAQILRDVRITAIYEGTTAIQANDLIGRKLGRDRGAAMGALLADVRRDLGAIAGEAGAGGEAAAVAATRDAVLAAVGDLEASVKSLLGAMSQAPERGFAVSVPLLRQCGLVLGGWLLARSAAIAARGLAAGDGDRDFLRAKIASARFYAAQVLPQAAGLRAVVTGGAAAVVDVDAALV
jgi:hypothetical protein